MLTRPDFMEKQIIIALLDNDEKLSFKNDNIIITDADGKIKHQSSCYRLFLLLIVGHVSITSGLIQRAQKFRFQIVLMTHGMRPYAQLGYGTQGHVLLRKKQYDYDSFDIAAHLVKNKIDNQLQALTKIRKKSELIKKSIQSLKDYRIKVDSPVDDLHALLGIEGISSRVYFQALFEDTNWQGRKPRTKINPINTLLDIGYTKLFYFVEAMLGVYGFDIYQGFYHQTFYQRKSLVCDMVEPFRPMIDWRIRSAYNLGQIKLEDFHVNHNQYQLSFKNAKPYVAWLTQELIDNREAIFCYIQEFYRAFIQDKPIEAYPVWDFKNKM